MNHLFKKKELGFSGTYKNNNYFCLFYPTTILIYGFHSREEAMRTTAGNYFHFLFVLLLSTDILLFASRKLTSFSQKLFPMLCCFDTDVW